MLPIFAIVVLLLFAVGLLLFYLSSRLQFVLFDVVLRRTTTIAPVWRRYGPVTWRWIGLKLLLATAVLVVSGVLLAPAIVAMMHSIARQDSGGSPAGIVASLFAVLGAVFLVLLVAGIAYSLLADFALPSIALEGVSGAEAARRAWGLMQAEPGAVLLYVLLRFLLRLAGALMAYVGVFFGAILLGLVLALPAGALWLGLHHAGPAGHAAMYAGWTVLGLTFLAATMLSALTALGYVYLFMQAYALYFLSGRYPLLGALLVNEHGGGTDRPFTPPPPMQAPGEDDDGPGFPMDPALA